MKVEIVTALKRQATQILADLRASKERVLITEHGRPSAYLLDVDDFELMEKRLAILEGIARGERAIDAGQTFTQSQAQEKMVRWLR